MTSQSSDSAFEPEQEFHRDRHEHGGAPQHLDDDKLAHEAEEERVEVGLDPYDPDDVPPATDTEPLDTDIRDTEQYQEERAEIRREEEKDEILIEGERQQFPPSHYEP